MLRENLVEKLGSLLIAVVLVLYVQSQLHPVLERTYEVPIEMLNVPSGYEVRLEGSPRVRITVRGIREAWRIRVRSAFAPPSICVRQSPVKTDCPCACPILPSGARS
jgi:hypothetical protein